jgi:hypothetical protein
MSGAYDSPAARDLLGEPLVNVIPGEPVEDALTAALAALVDRYGSRKVSQALKAVTANARVGRPSKAPLEPREARLLVLFDTEPLGPDGRTDNQGFAAKFRDELNPQGGTQEAAEKQLQRLLRARKTQGQKPRI